MRFVWLVSLFGIILFGQAGRQPGTTLVIGPQNNGRAPSAHAPTLGHPRHFARLPLRYWGIGYGGYDLTPPLTSVTHSPPAQPLAQPPAPILASSSLYQPDRAQPVMREYGTPAEPTHGRPVALVAFRDGRVEPVQAYWREGDDLAFLTMADLVRRAPSNTVDIARSENLSRQQGVQFSLPKPRTE